ncbi:MAG: oligosaccharide flippase family protein [Bacteroidales bacterium]|jgi:O-antigen/teichoic acid export membrane protein|nr:oligosaccharide flippase family protein [Bacteroidales bacterium]
MLNTNPFFRKLHQSEFVRNVGTLLTGTAIAQAIPVLLSPVLSRLYTPDDFGILALFMAISIVISVIATGRYELAIMLPEEKRDASNLLALAVILTLLTSLVTFVLVLVFKGFIAGFFDDPGIENWLYFIPLVVLFTGVYNTFNYWSTRHKTFKRNAAARISQSTAMVGTNLGMGFAGTGAIGLVSGYILGQGFAATVLAWKTLKKLPGLMHDVSGHLIRQNAVKYRNFLRINTPHAFIGSLQDHGIVYVIMAFFNKAILGSYSFAFRLVTAPAALIGSSIYQVFYQRATRALQEGQDIQPMVLRIYRNLFVIGLPIFAVLFFWGPPIFAFVFGEEWTMAGEIASIIAPWLFLNFIATPVSCITVIMNKQWQGMMLSIADIALKVTAIAIGGAKGDVYLTFILMSILCGTLLIFSLFLFYKFAGIKQTSAY